MLIWKPNLTLIRNVLFDCEENREYRENPTFDEVIHIIMYGGYEKIIINAKMYSQTDMAIFYWMGVKKNVVIEELDNGDVFERDDLTNEISDFNKEDISNVDDFFTLLKRVGKLNITVSIDE